MRQATHPALNLLQAGRWDDAFGSLLADCGDRIGPERCQALLDALSDRGNVRKEIASVVDHLYSLGTPAAGVWALAWSMLTADPRKPASFNAILPQLQFAFDQAVMGEEDDADARARIRIWWRAAEAEWSENPASIFRIADVETRTDAEFPGIDADDVEDLPDPGVPRSSRISTAATLFADLGLPTLVVMPKSRASKLNNFHAAYQEIVDAALPLVVVRDVARIRAALYAEFPHATVAVDLMLRDLREGKPFHVKPIVLVSPPGVGKSRMVRRIADLINNLYVYRFDASSSADSHFGGTSKAWSNTEASVPARAVAQSKTANPIVLVDEIDKAAARNWNGRLWDAILPFLERETAGRYRDQSLDCELDLAGVSFIATANDVTGLPAPLRDRFRIVKMPTPDLRHLPQLASQVMADLAAEDESRHGDAPLASDELEVAGRAWAKAGFSMRSLQKIVSATLEARDSYAMRH